MSQLLTTDEVDERDRVAYWREMICAVYVDLDAEPHSGEAFFGSVEHSSWGDLKLSTVASDAQRVRRRSPASDCLLSLQMEGQAAITQAGRTAVLSPGDCALYDATAPYELAFDSSFRQVVLQFPREALIARNVHIESAVAQRCSATRGLGAVAAAFIHSLTSFETDIPEESRQRLGTQALDMTASALLGALGLPSPAEANRSTDRYRVLRYIDAHLTESDLSVSSIAEAHGVSPRSLQKLFASDETGLSERIRLARVAAAQSSLRDPLKAHHNIGRIAFDLGFSSPRTFSRVFRSIAGCTPKEYRSNQV